MKKENKVIKVLGCRKYCWQTRRHILMEIEVDAIKITQKKFGIFPEFDWHPEYENPPPSYLKSILKRNNF